MLDLLVEEKGMVNVILFNQCEENLKRTLTHPLSLIVSDGFYVRGKPHPRLHGTFPELLGNLVRDRKWMPLEEAVHKITAKPAARLSRTSHLEAGAPADLTIFDAATVSSRATYESPQEDPIGIRYVIRQGKIVHQGAAA